MEEEDLSQLSNDELQARVTAGEGKPDWHLDDSPDPVETYRRIHDFLGTHALGNIPWESTAEAFKEKFPGIDPSDEKDSYQRYGDDFRLELARRDVAQEYPREWHDNTRILRNFTNILRGPATTLAYGIAKNRFDAGQASPGDMRAIAMYEQEKERDAEDEQSVGGAMTNAALRMGGELPAFMLGSRAVGQLAKAFPALGFLAPEATGAVAAPLLTKVGAAQAAGRLVAGTAALPHMYLEEGMHRNIDEGRNPLDPRGLGVAGGHALAQVAVLGATQSVTGKIITSQSTAGQLGRIGLAMASSPFGQAAADVASYAMGLQSRYGALQDIVERNPGDALRNAVVTAMTFAAFAVAHETGRERQPAASQAIDGVLKQLNEAAKRGLPELEAAKNIEKATDEATRKTFGETGIDEKIMKQVFGDPEKITESAEKVNAGEMPAEVKKSPQAEVFHVIFPDAQTASSGTMTAEWEGRKFAMSAGDAPNTVHVSYTSTPERQAALDKFFAGKGIAPKSEGRGSLPGEKSATGKIVEIAKQLREKGIGIEIAVLPDRIAGNTAAMEKAGFRLASVRENAARQSVQVWRPLEKGEPVRSRPPKVEKKVVEPPPEEKPAEVPGPATAMAPEVKDQVLEDLLARTGLAREPSVPPAASEVPQAAETPAVAKPPLPESPALAKARARMQGMGPVSTPGQNIKKPSEPVATEPFPKGPAKEALTKAGQQAAALREKKAMQEEDVPSPQERYEAQRSPDWRENVMGYSMERLDRRIGKALEDPTPDNVADVAGTIDRLAQMAVTRGLDPAAVMHEHLPKLSDFLDKIAENPKLLPLNDEVNNAINAAAAVAERFGIDKASLRRSLAERLQGADEAIRSTHAEQTPEEPASAQPESEPTPSRISPAPSHQLKLTPNQKKMGKEAFERGLSPAEIIELHGRVAEARQFEEASLAPQQQVFDDISDALEANGLSMASVRTTAQRGGRSIGSLPGMDEAAATILRQHPEIIQDANQLPSEAVAEYIQNNMRRPSGRTESEVYRAVMDQMDYEKELGREGMPASALESDVGSEYVGDIDKFLNEFQIGDEPVPPPSEATQKPRQTLADLARNLLSDESGFVWVPSLQTAKDAAMWAADYVGRAARYTRDAFGRLSGEMFPAVARADRDAAEKTIAAATSRTFAKIASDHFGDIVLGRKSSEEFNRLVGATILEMRTRKARKAYLAAGDTDAAAEVVSFVGHPDSPLKSEQDFINAIRNPDVQGAIRRYQKHYVPEKEHNFRMSQGLDDTDPINSMTQIDGLPISAFAVRSEQPLDAFGQNAGGNYKNLKIRKDPRAYQAKLNNEGGYELDLRKIIEKDLSISYPLATKAEMARTFVDKGLAKFAPPVSRLDGMTEIPFSRAPKGTQETTSAFDVIHVRDDLAQEFLSAWKTDPLKDYQKVAAAINGLFTKATLASSVEMATHSTNLMSSMLTKPSGAWHGGFGDFIGNTYQRIMNYPAFRERLMELARLGAVKPAGLESGIILPERFKQLDPTFHAGRVLEAMSDITRVTLSDWFDRLAAKGLLKDVDAVSKANFINQSVGQYEKSAQNGLVKWFRDTGFGPFATAGTTFNIQGLKSLGLGTNVKAAGMGSAVQMRAEVLGKMAAIIGGSMIYNLVRWGRADGDERTPFMAIKIDEDKSKGLTTSIDLSPLVLVKRGLRQTGALAYIEAKRAGKKEGVAEDRSVESITSSLMHPVFGPGLQFAHTAMTGKNAIGMNVAEKPKTGEAHWLPNIKAAIANANPGYATIAGADQPGREVTTGEKVSKLLGPLAPKYRYTRRPKARTGMRPFTADSEAGRP